ncbi:hypothetical protein AMTR_s00080p00187400 [Amborella trichopoda]|uniref:Uncharacterized protein n=1 Tax=Amborella trichopoda TaxID=13333 RepID=W1PD57_AMBTC|nr:hypothetical protein AMTR_s00080p00187400 [Amborella trichopoda]
MVMGRAKIEGRRQRRKLDSDSDRGEASVVSSDSGVSSEDCSGSDYSSDASSSYSSSESDFEGH